MKNSDNSNGSKPAAFGNTVLPEVFYGIFKIQRKGVLGPPTPQLYTSAFASIVNNECEIVTAHDVAFKTEEEAKELLSTLPKPAMYVIMPVYMAV